MIPLVTVEKLHTFSESTVYETCMRRSQRDALLIPPFHLFTGYGCNSGQEKPLLLPLIDILVDSKSST